jgi:hypothetical protein
VSDKRYVSFIKCLVVCCFGCDAPPSDKRYVSVVKCFVLCFGYDAPTAVEMQLLVKRRHLVLHLLCHSYMNKNGWCVGLRIFMDSGILCLLVKFVGSFPVLFKIGQQLTDVLH